MNKQLLVDVRPFDISRTQIDESIKSKGKGDLQKTLLGTNHWTVN